MVRGFQGSALDAPGSVAACAKHYVGYGAVEGGRDYNSAWIPEILLRDVYLPPFHAARDAGVATFMSAFEDLNGVPATGNEFTLRQILRGEWKFDGFVVSDYTSVGEMVAHGYAADHSDAALKGVRAGLDMEMGTSDYHDHLKELVDAGKVDVKLIDEAVRNILRVKFRLGLFDKPVPSAADPAALLAPESLEVAKKLAAESAVLLKNDGGALPLAKSVGKLAVIGPLADSVRDQMGCWTIDGRSGDVRTFLAALKGKLGADRVLFAPGLKTPRDTSRDGFPAAVEAARAADAVVLFLGKDWNMDGEARSRAFLDLPGAQAALAHEVAAAGKPVIAVIEAGRPLTFADTAAGAKAVLYVWNPGTMGGPAVADLLFGDAVPSGKLTVTFPRTVGQVPLYYAHLNTGRPPTPKDLGIPPGTPINPRGFVSKYIDVDFTPQYPFDFGLSYTTFEYSNLRLSAPEIRLGGQLTVTADLTNTGRYEAEEVVQLYTRDLAASVSRPVRELQGFRRVRLKPGEKRSVAFTIGTADLSFRNTRMQLVTEPDNFRCGSRRTPTAAFSASSRSPSKPELQVAGRPRGGSDPGSRRAQLLDQALGDAGQSAQVVPTAQRPPGDNGLRGRQIHPRQLVYFDGGRRIQIDPSQSRLRCGLPPRWFVFPLPHKHPSPDFTQSRPLAPYKIAGRRCAVTWTQIVAS